MKRIFVVFLALCLLIPPAIGCTSGASHGVDTLYTASPDGGAQPPDATGAQLACTVVALHDGMALLAGEDVYRISVQELPVLRDGRTLDASALSVGMHICVGYDGTVAETFPAKPGAPSAITILDDGDGRIALCFQVFDDLMKADPALSANIRYLGVDLDAGEALTGSERSAIAWRLGELYGAEPLEGTFQSLSDEGYIDRDALYWEDGVLLSLKLTEIGEDALKFEAEKWRSGLGALYWLDCTARRGANGWTYEIGQFAIS